MAFEIQYFLSFLLRSSRGASCDHAVGLGIGRAFYCFVVGKRIVVLHACIRKSQQAPDRELQLERKRMKKYPMVHVKHKPVPHKHKAFVAKAKARKGVAQAYDAVELEYQIVDQMLKARVRAGLTQDSVAERMGTTKSAISRFEGAGKHSPSITTLQRYANAVGCDLQVKLVPQKTG